MVLNTGVHHPKVYVSVNGASMIKYKLFYVQGVCMRKELASLTTFLKLLELLPEHLAHRAKQQLCENLLYQIDVSLVRAFLLV